MSEYEVTVNYTEEFPSCGDYGQEIAVEKADSEEYEYLTEAAKETNPHAIHKQLWVLH